MIQIRRGPWKQYAYGAKYGRDHGTILYEEETSGLLQCYYRTLLLKYIEVYSLVTVAEFISLTADHSQGVGAVYDPLSQSGGCGTEYYS